MKVILLEEVKNLGKGGDVVTVKDGYARNFLFPKNLAVVADKQNLNRQDHIKKQQEEKDKANLQAAQELKTKVEQATVAKTVKAGENGKIFGSITSMDIVEELQKQGLDIDKKQVELAQPIKEVGEHKVEIKLHQDVKATVQVIVSAEAPAKEAPVEEAPVEEAPAQEDNEWWNKKSPL